MSRGDHRRYDAALQKLRAEALQQRQSGAKFKWQDSLALVGLLLTVVGFVSEDTDVVIGCFAASALLICLSAYSHKEWGGWRYIVGLLTVLLFFWLSFRAHAKNTERELSLLHDVLIPANDPDPFKQCAPVGDEVALYFGANAFKTDNFPLVVLSIADKPVVTLDRDAQKGISVSMDVIGIDGKIVARIDKNAFTVNPNNYLSQKRPDRSTLVVTDQYGDEVLNIRYVNPKVVQPNAKLYLSGKLIDSLRGIPVSGICFVVPKGPQVGSVLAF